MGEVSRQNFSYYNVSCGHLKTGSGETARSISAYSGILLEIKEEEDKFENKPVKKIALRIQDDSSPTIAIVKMTKESWYALGFFARIQKIDVTKPFVLGVLPSDQNEKMSFCYLKQDGIDKIEADKNFPRPKKVKISDKDVMDWSDPFKRMAEVMAEVNAKIPKASTAVNQPDPASTPSTEPPIVTGVQNDDLPF